MDVVQVAQGEFTAGSFASGKFITLTVIITTFFFWGGGGGGGGWGEGSKALMLRMTVAESERENWSRSAEAGAWL